MTLMYNGHDLEAIGICGEPSFEFAQFVNNEQELDNVNGSKVLGTRMGISRVTFKCSIFGTAPERRVKMSTLASWLVVDEPKQLVLPDSPGWYYMAVPDGAFEIADNIDPWIFKVTFKMTDPIAYGVEEHHVAVPYGGSITFTVGGTAPTKPYFNRTVVRPDQTTKQWGWRLDSQDVFVLDCGTTSNRYIQADFGERISYVNDVIKLPTINSDWFELTPGVHTIENHIGGGTSVLLRWHERWY